MKSKSCFTQFLWAWMLVTAAACAPGISPPATIIPTASDPSVRAVFEGITPCSAATRPLPQIPANTYCEQMIWKIVLHQDPATGAPGTYTLQSAYGVPQQGTPGLVGGGTPIEMAGSWAIVKGTKMDPDAVLYRLNSEDPPGTVSFLRMSADILHILDHDQALMVGNAAWSYTLNRTDNRLPTPMADPEGSALATPTRPAIPPAPEGASVLGVFEGRLPCHQIVLELAKIPLYPDCAKIKSRLTLYQDQDASTPDTYTYMGTSTIYQGTWTVVRGTAESDPDAAVYQLLPDAAQRPISFLRADENHLFLMDRAGHLLAGNALFSYTLSRTDPDAQ